MTMVIAHKTHNGEVNLYSDNKCELYNGEYDSIVKSTIVKDWIIGNYGYAFLNDFKYYIYMNPIGKSKFKKVHTMNQLVDLIIEWGCEELELFLLDNPNELVCFVVVDFLGKVHNIEFVVHNNDNEVTFYDNVYDLNNGEYLIFGEGHKFRGSLRYYMENEDIEGAFRFASQVGECISESYDNIYF